MVRVTSLRSSTDPSTATTVGGDGGDRLGLHLQAALEVVDLHRDIVQRDFRQIEQHQRFGPELKQLARQLRPDRAAGAGDHHHFALHVGGQQLEIGRHRIASQQILDVDRPEVAHLDIA